jgi:hypothetical protein
LKGFILRVGYKEEQAWPSLPLLDSSLLINKQAKGVLVFSSKVVNAGKRQHTIKKKKEKGIGEMKRFS